MNKDTFVYVDMLKKLDLKCELADGITKIIGGNPFQDVSYYFMSVNSFPPSTVFIAELDTVKFISILKTICDNVISFRIERYNDKHAHSVWVQAEYENSKILIAMSGFREFKVSENESVLTANHAVIAYNPMVEEPFLEKINLLRDACIEGGLDSFLKPHIQLLSMAGNELDTVSIEIDGYDISDEDLDLHYGEGFTNEFHQPLLKKLTDTKKGIVLLHGIPGTGKTNYIRKIIRDLHHKEKAIIFMPKSLLAQIGTPSFNQFMVSNMSGVETVLVLEDAESALCKREQAGDDGSNIVSTILNITDGIMNDLFPIQIIATFNTDLQRIDDALLRSGRLIARREFGKLSVSDSSKLLSKIKGEDIRVRQEMTLADIYAENTTVIGINNSDKKKVGF